MSSTSAPPQGTGSEEQGSLLATYKKFKDLFDAAPGYIKALAALLTAFAALVTAFAGWFAADRSASGAPAQPTVYTTVTATATATVTEPGASSSSLPAAGGTAPPVSRSATTPPAAGTDLYALQPISTSVDKYTAAQQQQIGTTTYPDGIRFSCTSGGGDSYWGYNSVTYNVSGYSVLTATIGVPPDASNAAGNSATIEFEKDGTSTRLHPTVTVALDSPQTVQVQLQGTSQLVINCTAANADGGNGDDIDVVIGAATLSR